MQRLVELGADIAVIEKSATDFVTKTSGTRTCKGCGKKLRAGKACGKCAAKIWGRKAVELVIGHTEPAVALTIKSSRTDQRRDEDEMKEVTAGSSGASKGIQRVRPHTRGGKPVRGYDRFHVVRVAAYRDAPAGSHLSEATRHAVADRERANGIVTNNFASREEAQREADALNAEHRSGSSVGDDDGNDDLDSSVRDSDSEINLWIDNDEGLYSWWKESRASKQDFIDEHRDELTEAIERAGGNLMEDREIRLWVLNDEGLYNDWIASGGDPDEDVSQAYIDEHRDELVPAIRQRMKGKSVSRAKIEKVMREYKHGELHSGSKTGPKVKKRKQAIAIALSEASKSQMVVVGGAPETQD